MCIHVALLSIMTALCVMYILYTVLYCTIIND